MRAERLATDGELGVKPDLHLREIGLGGRRGSPVGVGTNGGLGFRPNFAAGKVGEARRGRWIWNLGRRALKDSATRLDYSVGVAADFLTGRARVAISSWTRVR